MSNFSIAHAGIDVPAFRQSLEDVSSGACLVFEGWVRNHNDGRGVLRLTYEVFEPLALKEGELILEEAKSKFDISRARAIHRSGELALSEPAVVVGVASSHRDAAFLACRYIIDEIKSRLPIWKKEYYADGNTEWVNCQHSTQSPAV